MIAPSFEAIAEEIAIGEAHEDPILVAIAIGAARQHQSPAPESRRPDGEAVTVAGVVGREAGLASAVPAEVEGALGPPGTANPYNVPIAARVLGVYALLFQAPDDELHSLADNLNDARMAIAG